MHEAHLPLLAATLSIALFVACGDPAGTPCLIEGDGFSASHDCRHRCLSRWSIECPSGERVTPNACTGRFGCQPGSCPEGQACYHDDDPFDDRSFCVMADTCGPLDRDALRAWERERVAEQEAVRSERARKEARRAKWRAENPDAPKHSAPAVDSSRRQAPQAEGQ